MRYLGSHSQGLLGIPGDVVASVATWTKDATSGKGRPVDATEWSAIISRNSLGISTPDHLWNCQETAGTSFADAIGAVSMSHSLDLDQAITGWASKGAAFTDNTGDLALAVTGGGSSRLVLAYITIDAAPAGDRTVIYNNQAKINYKSTDVYSAGRNTGTMTDGTASHGTAVHPVVSRINVTDTPDTMFFCTDLEKIEVAETSADSSSLYLGGVVQNAPGMKVLYIVEWEGAGAEMTNTQVKNLIEALGWTVSWSP